MFEENKLIVMRWLCAVSGQQDDVWDSYASMDPEMSWTLIGTTGISGTFNGLDEINAVFQHRCWHGDVRGGGLQGLDPEYGIKPLMIREITALEDGRIFVHCFSDGRGRNGIDYKNEYGWLITVREGRIAALYEFADTALIERTIFDKCIVPSESCS